jgi:excisionase family DNA binding protein
MKENKSRMLEQRVLTVKELADFLRVHPSTVYRLLQRDQLPAFRVGSDWRFNLEAINRWRMEQAQSHVGDTRKKRRPEAAPTASE